MRRPKSKELISQPIIVEVEEQTPNTKIDIEENKTPSVSRRRPRTVVKALTTSELSEKYNKLLDHRLEIAKFQKTILENQINNQQEEHELKIQLLKYQISIEKKKL